MGEESEENYRIWGWKELFWEETARTLPRSGKLLCANAEAGIPPIGRDGVLYSAADASEADVAPVNGNYPIPLAKGLPIAEKPSQCWAFSIVLRDCIG